MNLFINGFDYIAFASRGVRLRAAGWAFFYCALCHQFINLFTFTQFSEWSFLAIFMDSLAATSTFAALSFLAFRLMESGGEYLDSVKYTCVEYVLSSAKYSGRLIVAAVFWLGLILTCNGYLYYVDIWLILSIMVFWGFLYFYTLFVELVAVPDLRRSL